MALNPQYMIAPSVQEFFIDKISLLPMSGGQVSFYSDVNRNVYKPIYTLSGTYPNYSYIQLANPVTLTAAGTFSDSYGNDVLPYYYPYNAEGALELYYIEVYNSTGTFQFSRQAYPNIGASSSSLDFTNYIYNGQFAAHLALPYVGNYAPAGETVIAPGGWYYDIPSGSTALDAITFPQLPVGSTPEGFPRYAIQIQNVSGGSGDAYKRLVLRFPNVNTFMGQTLYFYFSAIAYGSSVPISISIIQYYGGTGAVAGSTVTTAVGSVTVGTSWSIPQFTLIFPATANNIGTNGDDYVEIAINLPINTPFNIEMTSFVLTDSTGTLYPNFTQFDTISNAVAGSLPIPAANGADLYLPIVSGPTGLIYDSSSIGKIYASLFTAQPGELLCDGSMYYTYGYSANGIPYSRLQSKLLAAGAVNLPLFGTGANFVTALINNNNKAYIFQNTFGQGGHVAIPTDVNSGFGFTLITPGSAGGFAVYASKVSATEILLYQSAAGLVTAAADHGTSFVPATYDNYANSGLYAYSTISSIGAASTLSNGNYFNYYDTAATRYAVFYGVDTPGEANPDSGSVGILVNVTALDVAGDVANKTLLAIAGGWGYSMSTVPAGSAVVAGSYWTFGTSISQFFVWYTVNSSGTIPSVPGAAGIQVNVLSTDSANTVAAKTVAAIDSTYFAVPNYQGMFLRGWDPNSDWDTSSSTRQSQTGVLPYGNAIGTTEIFSVQSHLHSVNTGTGGSSGQLFNFGDSTGSGTESTNLTGIGETRPVNTSVYYVIKY